MRTVLTQIHFVGGMQQSFTTLKQIYCTTIGLLIGNISVYYIIYAGLGRFLLPECFQIKKTKLHGLSPRANYTDRATAACQRSDCQLVRIEGATWSA
jgi:hypothetical protein